MTKLRVASDLLVSCWSTKTSRKDSILNHPLLCLSRWLQPSLGASHMALSTLLVLSHPAQVSCLQLPDWSSPTYWDSTCPASSFDLILSIYYIMLHSYSILAVVRTEGTPGRVSSLWDRNSQERVRNEELLSWLPMMGRIWSGWKARHEHFRSGMEEIGM